MSFAITASTPCIDTTADVTSANDETSSDASIGAPETNRVAILTASIGDSIRRFFRKNVVRSSAVGIVATMIDFAVLELLVRVLHLDRTAAKIPALALGTLTQFLGSRYYAFNAGSGALGRQLKWFVFVEFCAYWATVGVFHLLESRLHVPMEIANLASGSVVYFGFSYPIWKRVFSVRPSELVPPARGGDPQPNGSTKTPVHTDRLDLDRAV